MRFLWVASIFWITSAVTDISSQCQDGIYSADIHSIPYPCPPCPTAANRWRSNITYQSDSGTRSLSVSFEGAPCGCGFSSYSVKLLENSSKLKQRKSATDNHTAQRHIVTFKDLECDVIYTVHVRPVFKHRDYMCCPNCDGGCNTEETNYCLSTKGKNIKLVCDGSSPKPSTPGPTESSTAIHQGPRLKSTATENPITSHSPSTPEPTESNTAVHTTYNSQGDTQEHDPRNTLLENFTGSQSTGKDKLSHTTVILYCLMGIIMMLLVGLILYYIITRRKAQPASPPEKDCRNVVVALNTDSGPGEAPKKHGKDCIPDVSLKISDERTEPSVKSKDCVPDVPLTISGERLEHSMKNEHEAVKEFSVKFKEQENSGYVPDSRLPLEEIQRKRVFILYEDDHKQHRNVIQCLATYLQNLCNCDVIFDEWYLNQIGQDSLTWILNEIDRADKCLIIISQGAHAQYRAQCDQVKIEYNCTNPKGNLFAPAIWKVKQEFYEQNNVNKFVHVSFPYSERNICGQDFIIRDIYPRMHFKLMDHIEQLVMNIHGLQKLTPGKTHIISGVCKEEFTMYEEGKALKMAIDDMVQLVQDDPDWFSSQCQYVSISTDSGLSTLHREFSLDKPSSSVSPSPQHPMRSISKDSGRGEEAHLSSVLPDELFLPSFVDAQNDSAKASRQVTDTPEGATFVNSNNLPVTSPRNLCQTSPSAIISKDDCSSFNAVAPQLNDPQFKHWPFVSPDDIPDIADTELPDFEDLCPTGYPRYCIGQDVQGDFNPPRKFTCPSFLSPDQISFDSDCMSDLASFIERGSISDAKYYINIREPGNAEMDGGMCDDYNDDDAHSV